MLSALSERLEILRKQKKISQSHLAERAGVSRSSISAYEKGTTLPSVEVGCELCSVLDTTSDYLLGLDNKRRVSVDGLSPEQTDTVIEIIKAFCAINERCDRPPNP